MHTHTYRYRGTPHASHRQENRALFLFLLHTEDDPLIVYGRVRKRQELREFRAKAIHIQDGLAVGLLFQLLPNLALRTRDGPRLERPTTDIARPCMHLIAWPGLGMRSFFAGTGTPAFAAVPAPGLAGGSANALTSAQSISSWLISAQDSCIKHSFCLYQSTSS